VGDDQAEGIALAGGLHLDQSFVRVPSQDKGALVRNRATGSSLPALTKTGLEAHILGFGPSLT
jgi:hypothetical protein